tara:strand:+ start:864 stop:1175 length:312 start_codon:yes stop_codon:yes gene_type:complete
MAITCTVTRGFTFATGVDLSSANLNELGEPTVTVPSVTDTTVVLQSFAVAGLPTPGTAGKVVYCTDGDGGSPCLAVDNGSSWLRINLGAAVSATDAEEYIIAE